MTALVLCWCLSAQSAPGAGAPVRPGVVELLGGEAAYRAAQGPESVYFDGTVRVEKELAPGAQAPPRE
jgi:hypothetical protein